MNIFKDKKFKNELKVIIKVAKQGQGVVTPVTPKKFFSFIIGVLHPVTGVTGKNVYIYRKKCEFYNIHNIANIYTQIYIYVFKEILFIGVKNTVTPVTPDAASHNLGFETSESCHTPVTPLSQEQGKSIK